MASLYDLTAGWQWFQTRLETCDDAELEEVYEQLDQLQLSIDEKITNITRMVRNVSADAEALKAEEKRLAERRKACENTVKRLREYLYDSMKGLGLKKFKTSIGTWSIATNPISVTVLDVDKVPAKYHIPQPDTIDKAAIRRDHEATGEIVDGVDITQGEGLRFR